MSLLKERRAGLGGGLGAAAQSRLRAVATNASRKKQMSLAEPRTKQFEQPMGHRSGQGYPRRRFEALASNRGPPLQRSIGGTSGSFGGS